MNAAPPDPRLEAALRAALAAMQSRDFAAVERHARAALESAPDNYDALHLLALAALNAGRPAEALPRLDALDARHPGDPYAGNTRGAALQALGRLEEAAAAYEAAARQSPPAYADAWLNLGLARTRLGRHREAAEAFRRVQSIQGPSAQVSVYLGVALFEAGDAPGAELAFRDAVSRVPHNAVLRANHAAALLRCARHAEAAEAARAVLSLEPGHGLGHEVLVAALLQAGSAEAAVAAARDAESKGVATGRIAMNEALACAQLDRYEEACAASSRAVARDAGNAEVQGIDAYARLLTGDLEGALAGYRRAAALAPDRVRWRFLEALACPPILESKALVQSRLQEVDAALGRLEADPGRLSDPFREVGLTPFYFAYLGVDDTRLQRRFASAFLAACPQLAFEAPRPAARGTRLRVGICSTYLRDHTIGKLNLGFVEHLDRRRFEVVVARPPCTPDTLSALFDRAADEVIALPRDIAGAREALAAARLDAIFYPDIGMEPFTYFLAFARVAPLQFTTWGHPVTTGIPNMDCYVSTRRAEPPDGAERYTERLVAFDALPSFYHRPRPASGFDVRAQLGVGSGTRLYACPQTLFKFHPDLDAPLVEILRRDREALLLLVQSRHRSWNERLSARLARAGPDVASRIRFLPPMPLADFLAMLRDVDALLDTFHFGGGSSSYEALSLGAAVVTLPAESMRGRITAAWYDALCEDRWIASSPADFVERALALAHAPDRASLRRELAAKAAGLMENEAVVRELEGFLEREIARATGR